MAKIKYDVSTVESSEFPKPEPGIYRAKVREIEHRTERGAGKDDDLKVVLEVVRDRKFKGARLFTYVGLGEASAWKLKEFVNAVGLKAKGALDPDALVGEEMQVRVVSDTYQGEYQPRVKTFLALPRDDDDDDDDDDEEDEEDEDEDEEDEDYSAWTLKQLRMELKERGLEETGKKAELVERLVEDDEDEEDPF